MTLRAPRGFSPSCILGLAAAVFFASCAHAPSPLGPEERARLLLHQGDASAALPLLERLHAERPEDAELARLLTEAHVRRGSGSAFVAELSGRPDPWPPTVHFMIGLAQFALRADASGDALAHLEEAARLAPQEPEFAYRLGLALLESERYAQAVPPLRRAAEQLQQRPSVLLPLAKALHRTGEPAAAVEALRRAVQGGPSPSEVRTARVLMEQISDPFARVPQAGRRKLDEGLAWLERADVPREAILAFEELLLDYPDLAVIHALLGLAHQRLDDAGRAVEELRRAIELAPDDGRSHYYLGLVYQGRQRPAQARAAFERAVQLHPLLDEAYLRLGDLSLEQGDLVTAIRAFRTLSQLQPNAPAPRGKLALALQLQGDLPGAQRTLEEVMEGHPDNVEFMLRLGLIHAERYKTLRGAEREEAARQARAWLGKVLHAQPENALASRALQSVSGR